MVDTWHITKVSIHLEFIFMYYSDAETYDHVGRSPYI